MNSLKLYLWDTFLIYFKRLNNKLSIKIGPPPKPTPKVKKPYNNPIKEALRYQEILSREGLTKAELARKLGISRVRVVQIMNLLKLSEEIKEQIYFLNNNLFTERRLRHLTRFKNPNVQKRVFEELSKNYINCYI